MKLVYFLLKDCHNIEFNLDINLSENYFFNVTGEGVININDLKETFIGNFYGMNINNVTALVGKNGTGKSTILNLLGLKRLDLISCYPNSSWIAIYENESEFYLEGFNVKKLVELPEENSKFIAYKMLRHESTLRFLMHINRCDELQNEFFIVHQPDFSNSNKVIGDLHHNDDRNYGFKRNYLALNTANFYEFVSDNKNNFCSHLHSKNIRLKIKKNNFDEKSNHYKFYDNFQRYCEIELKLFGIVTAERIKNSNQLFVINLLEEYVMLLIESVFEEKNSLTYREMLEENIFKGDHLDYIKIKNHFFKLIEKITASLIEHKDESIEYTGSKNINNVIEFIEKSNFEHIKTTNGFHIEIDIKIPLAEFFVETYNFIIEVNKSNLPLKFELPKMSAGEYEMNSRLAGINKAIKLSVNNNEKVKGFIILLDEYDKHLHPEWSRLFLNHLLNFITENYHTYNFQLIISTHSPYIISDIKRQNVIKIIYNDENRSYSSTKAQKSFASNIYDIMNDSFFLAQPIGAFAIKKINEAINEINNINSLTSNEKKIIIIETINSIDDEFIKKTLLKKLESQSLNALNNIELIDMEIENLKKLKEKIKSENKND